MPSDPTPQGDYAGLRAIDPSPVTPRQTPRNPNMVEKISMFLILHLCVNFVQLPHEGRW